MNSSVQAAPGATDGIRKTSSNTCANTRLWIVSSNTESAPIASLCSPLRVACRQALSLRSAPETTRHINPPCEPSSRPASTCAPTPPATNYASKATTDPTPSTTPPSRPYAPNSTPRKSAIPEPPSTSFIAQSGQPFSRQVRISELIPKAACFWVLVEGHNASHRFVDSPIRRHRLRAGGYSFGSDGQGCEKVDPSPHGRDGHAPFFSAGKSNFKGTMA